MAMCGIGLEAAYPTGNPVVETRRRRGDFALWLPCRFPKKASNEEARKVLACGGARPNEPSDETKRVKIEG